VVTKKDKHLAAAQKYLERGSFEKALTEFQGAVKEDPKDTRTWLRMAEVYVRLGHNDKATEVYQKTVDLYVEQGFFQRAVAVYKNIIKLSPDFVEARTKLADVFRQLGLLSDAVQQLEQAAALFQKSNRNPEALSAIKQIIDLNPEQPTPHIRYAELASQTGAIKDATAEFGEAAKLLKAQGRTEEFLRVAERLLHYEPDNLAMALEVASKYLDSNNARAALPRLKPVFEARPRDPEVLDLLARSFEQLNQPHKTLPVLKELARVYAEAGRISERNQAAQRALAMDPNDAEMQELLSRPHGAPVRPPTAPIPRIKTPSPMPSLTPLPTTTAAPKRPVTITFSEMEVPQALRNKYVSLPAEPLPASMSERINIATGLVEKPEGDAEVKRILAEADVFVKYGLVERAADHLRRVFERVPTHQGAHERLAAVLVQLGRKTEAAAEYETLAQQFQSSKPESAGGYARKALELNPGARRALEVLGSVGGSTGGVIEGSMPRSRAPSSESSISMELRMGTPEPDILESDEIEVLSDGVEAIEEEEFGPPSGTTGDKPEGPPPSTPQGVPPATTAATTASSGLQLQPTAGASNPFSPSARVPPAARIAGPFAAARTALGDDPGFDDEGANGGGKTEIGGSILPEVEAETSDTPSEPNPAVASELEQIDFFIDQGVADEALAMLDEIDGRYPGNPLIAERRQRLAALQFSRPPTQGAVPARPHGEPPAPASHPATAQPNTGEQDIETHADLGIMEKTMERYGAAIDHFKALLADPKREVFALSMIGECSEALGDPAEAIRCYQDALKRPSATAAEATQLYYQLGGVFHNLGDQSEALYYFERVYKRDPKFRDIQQRLAGLKAKPAAR
jgi:pilus assembly protein FimV